jgi:hypothetical protein
MKSKVSKKEILDKAVAILEGHLETLPLGERKRKRKALHVLVTSENEADHKDPRAVETSRSRR